MKNITTLIFLLILCLSAKAQDKKEINDQVQFWTSINSTWRLSDRWGVMGDFHIRRDDFIKDPNFYFVRAGGVYWFNDKMSVAGGGAALWLASQT